MPIMKTVTCGASQISGERMEMKMVATFDGAPSQTYTFNVSHKKHAISSYKTNSAPPPSADVNTLVNMSENDFKTAFGDYGRQLAVKMVGKDSASFNPSAPMNRVATKNIAFSSDMAKLGGNVHCFPFNLGPSQSPKCISLASAAFNDFKTVTAYLYRRDNNLGNAKNAWGRVSQLVKGRVGQPNELLTGQEVTTLEIRLQGELDKLVKKETGEQKKAESASKQVKPDGRKPFRSGG